MAVHGFLNICKPPERTSMDVVRLVKRLTRERKMGHGGTLDPMATGVLPICLGQATRVMEYLVEGTKTYRAEVLLGVTTDTYDTSGAVVRQENPSSITQEQVHKALGEFRGVIYQTPPMYSALKAEGKRLYQLARKGITLPRALRKVQVLRLEEVEWEPPRLTLEIECGRGVYIRALAHDLGQALGCGACLSSLARLRAGPFTLEEAVTLPKLEEAVLQGTWTELLYPPDSVLLHLQAAIVGDRAERYIQQGQQVFLGLHLPTSSLKKEYCRIYSSDGRLLAVAWYDRTQGLWQPEKVFQAAP